MAQTISIGKQDFLYLRENNYFYIDKTDFIRQWWESADDITLITRPRRFGKTLNMDMLRTFFEKTADDNSQYFTNKRIWQQGERYTKHQGKYPVIFITLKDVRARNWSTAFDMLKFVIRTEFARHKELLNSQAVSLTDQAIYNKIIMDTARDSEYRFSLQVLCRMLHAHHQVKPIIIVDEYDTPVQEGYMNAYYDDAIDFIRSFFSAALKDNPHLMMSILTGILRIAKESIFTGLNNLETDSVLHTRYGDAFGFTQEEVEAMLAYYNLNEQIEEVKKWYDGYLFNNFEIYNPWSILKYVNDRKDHVTQFPLPYWSNTSSNSIVHEMVEDADEDARRDLETLMDSGTIEKIVHEEITYADIHKSQDNLWNFLFFTGYLKKMGERTDAEGDIHLKMAIPNMEIKKIYRESITEWFNQRIKKKDRSPLVRALEEGDCEAAENFVNEQLFDTISYFDYAESYYHGFMAGLLKNAGRYAVYSNRESGNGRPDIVLTELKFRGRAMILELKISDTIQGMEKKCEEALAQIEEKKYAVPLEDDGYRPILKYAICFFKKGCIVRKAE